MREHGLCCTAGLSPLQTGKWWPKAPQPYSPFQGGICPKEMSDRQMGEVSFGFCTSWSCHPSETKIIFKRQSKVSGVMGLSVLFPAGAGFRQQHFLWWLLFPPSEAGKPGFLALPLMLQLPCVTHVPGNRISHHLWKTLIQSGLEGSWNLSSPTSTFKIGT